MKGGHLRAAVGFAAFALLSAFCISCTSVDAKFKVGRLTDEDVNYLVSKTVGALFNVQNRFVIPGKRRVALVREIVTDAGDRQTDVGRQVTEKLKVELLNSGCFVVIDPQAAAPDKSVAPEFVFSGRIAQSMFRQDDGNLLVRYDMDVRCADAESGHEFWHKKLSIAKVAKD